MDSEDDEVCTDLMVFNPKNLAMPIMPLAFSFPKNMEPAISSIHEGDDSMRGGEFDIISQMVEVAPVLGQDNL